MQTLSPKQIRALAPKATAILQEDDFLIMDVVYRKGDYNSLTYPCRFGGVVCLYCIEGEFEITIGLDEYEVRKENFIVSLPGDIARFSRLDEASTGKVRVLAISERMLEEMDFDLTRAQLIFENRMVKANLRYKMLIHRFRNLFLALLIKKHEDTSRSLCYMLRSMIIELEHLWHELVDAPGRREVKGNRLSDEFLALVARHHVEHRDLEFYSSRMMLSPKYLSAAVKAASGRTAVEWITSYVIMEAKHYLKHTGLPIKGISIELNFKSQADFYRYFQRHTSLTPKEYRKSDKLAAP